MPPETTTLPLDDPDYDGVPEYLITVYDWAYVNPRQVKRLDHNWVVKTLLFGNDQRLMRAYLDEIKPGDSVWQVAHVYGDLVQRAAQKVGPTGVFHLSDITPAQVRHGNAKLSGVPWASVFRADAASFASHITYNVICSFFLLHEVPESKKQAIVDHMLSRVPPGGKAVFVDYHRPKPWQPIGWLLRLVNAWLEPFAHALWQKSIPEYARHSGDFCWTRRTFFGGVYQCTIATRPRQ